MKRKSYLQKLLWYLGDQEYNFSDCIGEWNKYTDTLGNTKIILYDCGKKMRLGPKNEATFKILQKKSS